eukprot:TRINITY_DN3302_c0_g1_i1.p1 TRINITY_DN3302_c0_g1~~TRINITY_DN3302_c0_g1_i1.p1  ORF type:complete len:190 (-),score=100.39 TRINITY_DN3302_c0_g1_i1:119-688(-)
MQPLCTSNCLSMVLLIVCVTLALNVYNMRHANKSMSEQYTASNNEYAEAKTTVTKCEHDLKSQETVLGEVKAAVEAAKKQNSEVQTNLDTCKADLEKTKADKEKADKEKAEQDKAEQEKKEKEKSEEKKEEKKEEKTEEKKEEKSEEKKEEKTEEKKEEKGEEKKEEKSEAKKEEKTDDKKEESVTKEG